MFYPTPVRTPIVDPSISSFSPTNIRVSDPNSFVLPDSPLDGKVVASSNVFTPTADRDAYYKRFNFEDGRVIIARADNPEPEFDAAGRFTRMTWGVKDITDRALGSAFYQGSDNILDFRTYPNYYDPSVKLDLGEQKRVFDLSTDQIVNLGKDLSGHVFAIPTGALVLKPTAALIPNLDSYETNRNYVIYDALADAMIAHPDRFDGFNLPNPGDSLNDSQKQFLKQTGVWINLQIWDAVVDPDAAAKDKVLGDRAVAAVQSYRNSAIRYDDLGTIGIPTSDNLPFLGSGSAPLVSVSADNDPKYSAEPKSVNLSGSFFLPLEEPTVAPTTKTPIATLESDPIQTAPQIDLKTLTPITSTDTILLDDEFWNRFENGSKPESANTYPCSGANAELPSLKIQTEI